MKERMLYMCHVDWNWIKQRPHFLAEHLAEEFDLRVLYAYQNRNRAGLQKRKNETLTPHPLYRLPMAGRVPAVGAVADVLLKWQFARHMRAHKPDYVFLTYPDQLKLLPKSYTGKVIYDCMDNHVEMQRFEHLKNSFFKQEQQTLARADVVLVTSQHLMDVLTERYGRKHKDKMILVRNGYNGAILPAENTQPKEKDFFELAYFGTISHWFHFDFIQRSLEDFPNLRYKIIGPAELPLPQADRISYPGTVEHHKLFDAIQDTDCLIMPFVLNEIILAVDPVKLYEYINFNKNILTVQYDEILRFEPFVHFYTDYESFRAQIQKMMADNTLKYNNQQREAFLQENSWSARAKTIVSAIHSL